MMEEWPEDPRVNYERTPYPCGLQASSELKPLKTPLESEQVGWP